MELFNSLIKDTKALLGKGVPKAWDYAERDCWTDIGSSELVLQKDAAYELGAAGRGSANYVLFTSGAELVDRDQVLLYGPDLKEIKSDSTFARIAFLAVKEISKDEQEAFNTIQNMEFVKYHVFPEGYMNRVSPESHREQVRVSKQAIKKGISFKSVGADYISSQYEALRNNKEKKLNTNLEKWYTLPKVETPAE